MNLLELHSTRICIIILPTTSQLPRLFINWLPRIVYDTESNHWKWYIWVGYVILKIVRILLVLVRLRTEVSSSTWPWFELMTSRSWQYISCHWDACPNHLAISDLFRLRCNGSLSFTIVQSSKYLGKETWQCSLLQVDILLKQLQH